MTRSRPSDMKLQPRLMVSLERDVDDLVSLRFEPFHDSRLGAAKAHCGELRGNRYHHEVDVHVVLIDECQPSLPSFLAEPALDLACALFLGTRAAAADEHAAFLDDVEVPALEGARGHHVVDGNAEPLVGANGRVVLAAAPPVGHGRDDGAERRHDARIARIDLHRQLRLRCMRVHPDAIVLVGRHQFLVLQLRDANIRGAVAQELAGQ